MAKKQAKALGKGAAALFGNVEPPNVDVTPVPSQKPAGPIGAKKKTVQQKKLTESGPLLVDVKMISLNPHQPRKIFKEKELEELTQSVKENGIIQPLIVSHLEGANYQLVAGERRLRAAKNAGVDKVPVIVKRVTDREKMIMAIIENVQRSDLNCVEEALAYYNLMDEFNLKQEEVAHKLGKERSTVANFLRILKLPREVIEMLQKELLSFGHAKLLVSLKERGMILKMANLAIDNGFSVRQLEQEIKKEKSKGDKEYQGNPFFDEKLDLLRQKLEKRTGFHFQVASKRNGSGNISIKFSNEAEFNDIYEFLLSR